MTQLEINNLIHKVNEKEYLYVADGMDITYKKFSALIPYFDNITIETLCIDGWLNEDFFSHLAKLKQLSGLMILRVNFDNDEIEKGLPKLQNLRALAFDYCKFSKFPSAIFELKNLKYLSLYFSTNDIPCMHFFRNYPREPLSEQLEDVFQYNIFTATYEKYHWGYRFPNFIIMINNYFGYPFDYYYRYYDIDIFFLNTEKQYQNYKAILSVFKQLDEKYDSLKKEFNQLVCNTIYDNESYSLQELIQKYKIDEVTLRGQFIDKLLKKVGGEEILFELKNEKRTEQVKKALDFEKENRHIKSLQITNFKLFEKIKIQLDKINILIGQNGCGKTSLLQAIAIGLVPEASREWIPREEKFSYFIKSLINRRKFNEDDYSSITLKWNVFEKEHRLYSDKLVADKELPQTYLVLGYGENLFTNPRSGADIYIENLAVGKAKTYDIETLFNDYNISLPNPLEILNALGKETIQKYSKEEQQVLNSISDNLLSVLNRFLSLQPTQKFTIKNSGYGYFFVDKNKTEFSLNEISEGFRSNIVLITDILLKILSSRKNLFLKPIPIKEVFKNVKGTILIDEFDKHLHPVWQRTFLSALEDVLPNIQFVLTTHNVAALQSAEGHRVFVLHEDGNVELSEIPKGYSIEALYRKFFNEDYFSETVTKNIKDFQNLRDKILETNDFSKIESKEYKDLMDSLQISPQTKMIARIEENQLLKARDNVQTK